MNENKKRLIAELRQNSRKKLTEISEASKIPVSTLFDTIRAMETENIVSHKSIVDFEKIGFTTRILMALKTNITDRIKLKTYLKDQKNVNSIFQINTGYDYLIDAIFKNQKEMQNFIEELEFNNIILEKSIFNVIDIIDQEKFLTKEEHFE